SDLAEAFTAEQTLVERLHRAIGGPIRVCLGSVAHADGTLLRVGRDHFWVADDAGFWVIVTDKVEALSGWQDLRPGLSELARSEQILQPGLGSALRELVDSGRTVSVLVRTRWLAGKPTCVGRDFLEVGSVGVPFTQIRACRVWY
ncbi:MAG TPA: hypothetical protein VN108_03340, partial [Marmoricola sp.]|nr:hypothetical protein [Marmoricola sp.]